MIDLLYNISLHAPDLIITVGCAILFGAGGKLIARVRAIPRGALV